jgi:hypothetical protein
MKRLESLILLAAIALGAAAQPAGAEGAAPARTPARADTSKTAGRMLMKPVKLRGEIVDYFCYIQKGATGIEHKDCGTRCVAGDICMGLLTTDGDLYMISQDHMRAMDPAGYRETPNPFDKARGLMAWTVDLVGHAMERKGQRIVEIVAVSPVSGPVSSAPPAKPKAPVPASKKPATKAKASAPAPAPKETTASAKGSTQSCDVPESKSR